MTEEYAEYLNSEAWQQKRQQRLAISKYRCSACTARKAVHVHHLTYERIFNENMSDLLPLCETHHKSAELLIANGKLHRRGDVLFLATETLRLILCQEKPNRKITRNVTQAQLINDPRFVALLPLPRKQFKKALRRLFGRKGKVTANAFVLYDQRRDSILNQPIPINPRRSRPLEEGFKSPARKWSSLSEQHRHSIALDRANNWL